MIFLILNIKAKLISKQTILIRICPFLVFHSIKNLYDNIVQNNKLTFSLKMKTQELVAVTAINFHKRQFALSHKISDLSETILFMLRKHFLLCLVWFGSTTAAQYTVNSSV